ncbi:MAG: hypothetical protein OXK80_05430 [Bdellovibrionales bacterium]|nr:hypothetical protein [Bdellovibrionales bacterium]
MGISLFTLIEQGMGYLIGIVGLSVLLRTQNWINILNDVCSWKKQTLITFTLLCSFLYLPIGMAIVLIHNEWSWSSAVIVTILGWVMVLKMLVFLFFPEKVVMMNWLMNKGDKFLYWFFKIVGVIYIGLGLLVLCPYWF